jgi:hypothetical protein
MWRQLAMRRRARLVVVLGGLLSGALTPVAAQVVLYEDWATERIDPGRWRPTTLPSTVYEVIRVISGGQLQHALRIYGASRNDFGALTASNILGFTARDFMAVQWDTSVQSYLLQGCGTPGTPPSSLQVAMQLPLFNDGSSPDTNDETGNVEAHLHLVRTSDSPAAPDVLEAQGLLTRCQVPDCSTRDTLGPVSLGEIPLGQMNTLQMIWDPVGSQVIFRRNTEPPVPLFYSVPAVRTIRAERLWAVRGTGANCTAGRAFAEVLATLDNIIVFFP